MLKFLFILIPCSLFSATYEQPESASSIESKAPVFAERMMVASANPYASAAGLAVLEKGGNAIDAAIAMQMVLTLVEPQSSGIGGGGFLLYFRKKDGKVIAYDGRETAPQRATGDMFLNSNGVPASYYDAVSGGRAVGVPGLLKMLAMAHSEEGKMEWPHLFERAIELSREGFVISPRLYRLISSTPNISRIPLTRSYLFQENGAPKRVGSILQNPELENTFRLIAEEGITPFYKGIIAKQIVKAVHETTIHPGTLSLQDLENYKAVKRNPLKTSYRDFIVYGFPPPGGGIGVAQILGMLSRRDVSHLGFGSADFIQLFCQASRLAFADRDYYVADPDFFPVPTERLIEPFYVAERGSKIDISKTPEEIQHGLWPGQSPDCCPPLHLSPPREYPSTTQLCVVDSEGNAVSMTTSIEFAFGSGLMAGGFFLNNQMTDFSLVPEKEGKMAANRIEPGKRPMSAMSPTFVFHQKNDNLYLTLGSTGGGRIINYVAQALFGVLDFKLNIQEAISFPHYTAISESIDLEQNTFITRQAEALRQKGNKVEIMPLTSGSQGIQMVEGGMIGGADPRKEGEALGQ